MKKVKFGDKFFVINNEGFRYRYNDGMKKETGENHKYLWYQWVIPVYVYSINQCFDGKENFDLSNKDCSKLTDHTKGWVSIITKLEKHFF